MTIQNNVDGDSTENNPNNEEKPEVSSYDPRQEIESLKQYNTQILEEMRAMRESLVKKEPEMTVEQYQKLFQDNPAKAIELAVDKTVKTQLSSFKSDIDTQSKKSYYDQKVEQDFPALKTDREFQRHVSDKIQELVRSGEYHKDSPTLVLRAAQLASATFKGSKTTPSAKSMSSEAPSNVKVDPGSKVDTAKFGMWSKVFGLSDESQKRLMEKMAQKKGARR